MPRLKRLMVIPGTCFAIADGTDERARGDNSMATLSHPVTGPAVFPHDAENGKLFAENFDHHPFQFRHALDTMDIFQMPALLKLAERCMQKRQFKSHYETGEPVVDGFFGNKP